MIQAELVLYLRSGQSAIAFLSIRSALRQSQSTNRNKHRIVSKIYFLAAIFVFHQNSSGKREHFSTVCSVVDASGVYFMTSGVYSMTQRIFRPSLCAICCESQMLPFIPRSRAWSSHSI